MKNNEMKLNEMEKVSGGNFFADLEDVLRNIFGPKKKDAPEPVKARGKC